MILSILFSPTFRRILSNPAFVFLGSMSFPLYLLHGTFIRLFLAWSLFQLVPRLPFLNIVETVTFKNGQEVLVMQCAGPACRFSALIVFTAWFAGLLLFCRIWKNRVDILGVHFSKWAEDIVMGKRQIEMVPIRIRLGERLLHLGEKLSQKVADEKAFSGILHK